MKAPDIITDRTGDYADLIGHNWDSVQEAFRVEIPYELEQRLEAGKRKAIDQLEDQGMLFEFGGGYDFQIWAGASQGNKWVLECDDFQIHFGPPKRDWPVTVRYLSGGLWEHGFQALKDRVVALLEKECKPIKKSEHDTIDDWCHVSRADYCFDFYSPKFSDEMELQRVRDHILAVSGVKIGVVGTSTHDETITIGMNRKGLQIQIYDKGKEITEASGKTWMFAVWEREGYYPPDDLKAKHVWRVEVRFGKEFLKDRNIRIFPKLQDNLKELLGDALMRRRLITPTGDKNRAREPLHPLWAEVYHASGSAGEFLPIGRFITMRREEYKEMLEKQMAGLTRAMTVAERGHYDEQLAAKQSHDAIKRAVSDPDHEFKIKKNIEKQRFFNEAQ